MTDPRGRLLGFNEHGPLYSGLGDCIIESPTGFEPLDYASFPWGYTKMPAPSAEAVQRAIEGYKEAARKFDRDWGSVVGNPTRSWWNAPEEG